MNIKKWLGAIGVGVLVSGMLLAASPVAKALAAGGPPAGGQGGQLAQRGGCGIQMGRSFGSMSAEVAQFLGIDASELIAARQSGQSLAQLATAKGIGEQDLVNFIIGQRSAQIEQLVSDGKITQAQADLHKQFMTERVQTNINRTTVGPNRTNSDAQSFGGQGMRAGGKAPGQGAGAGYGRGSGMRAGTCPYANPAQ